MKYFIVLVLFISCQLYASEKECFTKSDVAILKKIIRLNDKERLKAMASEEVKHTVLGDKLLNNERSTLVNVSKMYYGWGGKERPEHDLEKFPASNICVWDILLTLPMNLSMKCDDFGAYGYSIQFKKVNGNIVMYSYFPNFIVSSNGKLVCKAANDFMFSKER